MNKNTFWLMALMLLAAACTSGGEVAIVDVDNAQSQGTTTQSNTQDSTQNTTDTASSTQDGTDTSTNTQDSTANQTQSSTNTQTSTQTPVEIIPINVALNKAVSQSSISAGGEAIRAVDGNTNGAYSAGSVTHTSPGPQPWWQIDLGSVEQITQINVFNRTDNCCTARLSDFYVLVSNTPFESDSLDDSLNNNAVSSFYFESTVDGSTTFDIGLAARYVRIQLAGSEFALSLAEVEIMSTGTLSTPETDTQTMTETISETQTETETDSDTDTDTGDIVGNIENGRLLFTDEACAACHDIPSNERNIWVGIEASIIQDAIINVPLMFTYGSDESDNATDFTDQELADIAAFIEYEVSMLAVLVPASTSIGDPETAVRRSKNIITGLAPTAAEVQTVIDDPTALKELTAQWVESDEFENKMMAFFAKTLQQNASVQDDYAAQLTSSEVADRWRMHEPFMVSMRESMARTALWIIENDRPFNEIASGRTWMMTTQMMAYLVATESSGTQDGLTFYNLPVTVNGIDYDADTPHEVQIENKMIYSKQVLNGTGNGFDCTSDPILFDGGFRDRLLAAFMSNGNQLICRSDIKPELFNNTTDAVDWRPVTMVRGEPEVWWNALAFRDATELTLRTSRTGYFSQPAFFATWRSNEDNDFRVTTNQALIVGLGRAFEETDLSIPLGDEGLEDEHAGPETDCYACHKTLDPMRTYFDVDFDPDFYGANINQVPPAYAPSFSFLDHIGTGPDLEDFGRHIAQHPYFSTGWVQKMCAYANAAQCNTADPEFQRIVTVFEESNLNFKTMMIELLASPLVTNTSDPEEGKELNIPISITRYDHFCPMLAARTGIDNICSLNSTSIMAGALPADAWGRGADEADQATEPGLFYRATIEALCAQISTSLLDQNGSPVQTSDIEGSIDWLVESFMGVSSADARFTGVRAALQGHYDAVSDVDTTQRIRLESVTTLACVSPFITSTDF